MGVPQCVPHFTTVAPGMKGVHDLTTRGQPIGVNCDDGIYGLGCAAEEYGAEVIQDVLNGGEQYDSAGNRITPAYMPDVQGDDYCPNCWHSLFACSCR